MISKRYYYVLILIILSIALIPNSDTQAYTNNVLDTFNGTQNLTASGTTPVTDIFSFADDLNIVGTERDITLTPASSANVEISIDSAVAGHFVSTVDVSDNAIIEIVYDGPDNSDVIDYNGLETKYGNLDLTDNQDTAFYIEFHELPANVPFRIQYYTDDSAHCSTQTRTFGTDINPGSDNPFILVFPFSYFTTCSGASGPASLTDIGAIILTIDGSSIPNADTDLNIFSTGKFDYGDLDEDDPTPDYGTTLAEAGAGHLITGFYMGTSIDQEEDGDPSLTASGDDSTGNTPDDENGVTPTGTWSASPDGGHVDVLVVGGNACLSAWVDWGESSPGIDFDGSFEEAGDNIILNMPVVAGNNSISFDIPGSTTFDRTFFARFRLFPRTSGDTCNYFEGAGDTALYKGVYEGGEVEDYQIAIGPTAVTLSEAKASSNSPSPYSLAAGAFLLVSAGIFFFAKRKPLA